MVSFELESVTDFASHPLRKEDRLAPSPVRFPKCRRYAGDSGARADRCVASPGCRSRQDDPIEIGNLTIPNRIKYAATEDNFNDHDGFVTDADVEYMRLRAEGVVGGLCVMQGVYMDEGRQGQPSGEGLH